MVESGRSFVQFRDVGALGVGIRQLYRGVFDGNRYVNTNQLFCSFRCLSCMDSHVWVYEVFLIFLI